MIGPSILFPIIDRLLGGGQEPSPVVRRPLTEIELRLVSRIAAPCVVELNRAWADVIDRELSVERVESSPRQGEILGADEPVVLLGFDVTVDSRRRAIKLCVPLRAIEPIRELLLARAVTDSQQPIAAPDPAAEIEHADRDSHVTVAVHLPDSKISRDDLAELRPGDIITTPQDIDSPWTVSVDGVAKFQARPGTHEGAKRFKSKVRSSRQRRAVERHSAPETQVPGSEGRALLAVVNDVAKDCQCGVHLLRGHAQSRAETDRPLSTADQQQAAVEGTLDDIVP